MRKGNPVSNDFLNPERQFRSIEEAANYFKTEMSDDKVMKYLKKAEMPINNVDPRVNHNNLMMVLRRVPQNTVNQKKYVQLLMAKSAVATQNALRGVPNNPRIVTKFLADWLGEKPRDVHRMEVRAVDYVKNWLEKNKIGSAKDLFNNDFKFIEKKDIDNE